MAKVKVLLIQSQDPKVYPAHLWRNTCCPIQRQQRHRRGGTEVALLLLSDCAFLWLSSEQRRNVGESGVGLKPLPGTWAPSIFCSVLDTLSDISCRGRCSEQSSLKKNESWQTLGLLAHTPVHRWLEFSNQITWQAISLSCSGALSEPWDSHIYITH